MAGQEEEKGDEKVNNRHESEVALPSGINNTDNTIATIYDESNDNFSIMKQPKIHPLRVCCYGSSSSKTPEVYLKEARNLGYILAKRGHTCVNGAGNFGCMAAMNEGASKGNGHIIGVIHEMFVIDGSDWNCGGAHDVFDSKNTGEQKKQGGTRELLIAGGDDLQERKKLLVDKADALVVLPGGPGTFDELWEMACARNLGLIHLPIVCISINNYYDPFRHILDRAYQDNLIRLKPEQIIHFEPTAEKAVQWIENETMDGNRNNSKKKTFVKKRNERKESILRKGSFLSPPMSILSRSISFLSSSFHSDEIESTTCSRVWKDGKLVSSDTSNNNSLLGNNITSAILISFATGLAFGVTLCTMMQQKKI